MAIQEHKPVLLAEVLTALRIRADGIYLDGTFGRGGHAGEILARLGPEGRLLATDKDPAAVAAARQRFGGDARFDIVRGSFSALGERVAVASGGFARQPKATSASAARPIPTVCSRFIGTGTRQTDSR